MESAAERCPCERCPILLNRCVLFSHTRHVSDTVLARSPRRVQTSGSGPGSTQHAQTPPPPQRQSGFFSYCITCRAICAQSLRSFGAYKNYSGALQIAMPNFCAKDEIFATYDD